MKKLSLEVVIPTYNGAETIKDAINSVLNQSYQDFTILVHDDSSKDDTLKIVSEFKDKRIKIGKNKKNLGTQMNLEAARKKTTADIVFWLCQDDILSHTALSETMKVYKENMDVGAVVRPYFWFDEDIKKPVRAVLGFDSPQKEVIQISDNIERLKKFFESVGQLSGLSYRASSFELPFHEDIFPGHVYVFASILKKHKSIYLRNFNVAVKTNSSQTRKISALYENSPTLSWIRMFKNVFPEKKFEIIRKKFIKDFVATNSYGLLQIKNYSTMKNLLREILIMIKYNKKNLLNLEFIAIALLTIITPPILLIKLVDWYKKKFLYKTIKNIIFY